MKLDNILRKMKKTEQRIYAIEQAKIKTGKGTEGSTEEVVSWKGKEGVGTENCRETARAE